jgi:hypothetical protein
MERRKVTSLIRIEANRRNAMFSTGPKTPEGKSVVKWNALKHGLLCKEIVVKAGDGKENKSEFHNLLSRLWEDIKPVGVLEEILVEKIAVCYWRLRRLFRCEIGEIRKELDTASWRFIFKQAEQVAFEKHFLTSAESRQNLKKNSLGLEYLIEVLDDVGKNVDRAGYLSKEALEKLAKNFGVDEQGITFWCDLFAQMAVQGPEKAKEDPENYGDTPTPERCKEIILDLIARERKKLQSLRKTIKENENLELEAEVASLALPSKEAVDKILRYETAMERQLYRAINELERLQRQRKGETVPPPINVEFSGLD